MIAAEQSLLGCLLNDPKAITRVAGKVTEASFSTPAHSLIFGAVEALTKLGQVPDVVTVFAHLQKQVEFAYLNEVAQSAPDFNAAERYAAVVAEQAAQRALKDAALKAQEIASGAGSVNEKLEAITTALQAIQRTQMGREPVALQSAIVRALERYEALAEGKREAAWSTGVRPLDEMFAGGLRPGKVYGIAARPSVGKSSAARQVAVAVAKQGLPVLVLSQEMPVDEVTDCLVAQLGHIDAKRLITGQLQEQDWERMVEAAEMAQKLPLHIDDDGGLTLAEVGAKARMVKGLKVLVLDYLQLCSSDLKGNTNEQVAEISKGLKRLALQMGIAVVVLSQLNRQVEQRQDKEPQLSDLRDSGAIEQDLDACVMLWTAQEEEDSRLVGWKVAKNRSGNRGVFAMRFFPATYSWFESSEPLRPEVVSLPKRRTGLE